jgi:hypothetical protein
MAAKIMNGVWTRSVPLGWKKKNEWRTDIFKSVLSDPHLHECHFVLESGPTIIIHATELRRVLEKGPDHYVGSIWGPFNINPILKTISGQNVQMRIA